MGSSWFRNAEKIKKKKIAVTTFFLFQQVKKIFWHWNIKNGNEEF